MRRPRLTSLDGSFLRVETPSAHMHVGWKGLLAPRARGGPIRLGELRASIAGRLDGAPRFRQRLAFCPGSLAEPSWVDDESFDLRWHVRRLGEPGVPLSRARFDALCDEMLSEPLDRSRALWQLGFAPLLEDGRGGLLMKVHHAMCDGTSAVQLALLLLDITPDPPPVPLRAQWTPEPAPRGARLAAEALMDGGEDSLRRMSALARGAASPRAGLRLADTLRRAAFSMGEDVLRPAPSSYVNVEIGPRRTLVHHTCAIAPLLDVKRRRGVTLNDVALTAVAGALRHLARRAGERPEPLKVMVPVSRRAPEQAGELGNRIAFVFIELPVHLSRATDRLASIHAATRAFKRAGRADGGAALMEAMGMLPEPLKDRAARMAASPRMYNLTVSNVPGPRMPVYLLGALLEEAVPVIPLADGHALSVGIFSFRDRLAFSAYADPDALPEAAELPAALNAAVLELGGRGGGADVQAGAA